MANRHQECLSSHQHYLYFAVSDQHYQFGTLCFGLPLDTVLSRIFLPQDKPLSLWLDPLVPGLILDSCLHKGSWVWWCLLWGSSVCLILLQTISAQHSGSVGQTKSLDHPMHVICMARLAWCIAKIVLETGKPFSSKMWGEVSHGSHPSHGPVRPCHSCGLHLTIRGAPEVVSFKMKVDLIFT